MPGGGARAGRAPVRVGLRIGTYGPARTGARADVRGAGRPQVARRPAGGLARGRRRRCRSPVLAAGRREARVCLEHDGGAAGSPSRAGRAMAARHAAATGRSRGMVRLEYIEAEAASWLGVVPRRSLDRLAVARDALPGPAALPLFALLALGVLGGCAGARAAGGAAVTMVAEARASAGGARRAGAPAAAHPRGRLARRAHRARSTRSRGASSCRRSTCRTRPRTHTTRSTSVRRAKLPRHAAADPVVLRGGASQRAARARASATSSASRATGPAPTRTPAALRGGAAARRRPGRRRRRGDGDATTRRSTTSSQAFVVPRRCTAPTSPGRLAAMRLVSGADGGADGAVRVPVPARAAAAEPAGLDRGRPRRRAAADVRVHLVRGEQRCGAVPRERGAVPRASRGCSGAA